MVHFVEHILWSEEETEDTGRCGWLKVLLTEKQNSSKSHRHTLEHLLPP